MNTIRTQNSISSTDIDTMVQEIESKLGLDDDRVEADDLDIKITELFGTIISDIDISNKTKFYIRTVNNRKKVINIGKDTLLIETVFHEGDEIWIGIDKNVKKPMALCSRKLYDHLLAVFPHPEECFSRLTTYHFSVSDSEKKAVLARLNQRQYESVRVSTTTDESLKMRYFICKSSYTPEQQYRIETLFNEPPCEKNRKILKALIGIFPEELERKRTPTYEELRFEMDKRIFGMDNVKELICDAVLSAQHCRRRGVNLLLVGSPGVGKTELAKTISQAFGLHYKKLSMSSMASSVDLLGIDSSYHSSNYGILCSTFMDNNTSEMVVVFDELDKAPINGGSDGNLQAAFLEVLQGCLYDRYIEAGISTEQTIFVATANSLNGISEPLLDRFLVIHVPDYTREEKRIISRDYLIPKLKDDYCIKDDSVAISSSALEYIINSCTDGGCRQLKRYLELIFRRVVARYNGKATVDADAARRILAPYIQQSKPYRIGFL